MSPNGAAAEYDVMSVVIKQPGVGDPVVWVVYAPDTHVQSTAMRLQLAYEFTSNVGGRLWHWPTPRVLCNLDRAKAKWVLKNGLPPGLEEAVVQKGVGDGSGVTMPVVIDPAPFFPRKRP